MEILFKLSMMVAFSVMTTMSFAEKKVQKFSMEKVIDLPAEKIWEIVGVDYGSVAYSHPKIVSSDYIKGTLKAEKGAERVCYFNDKGNQFLKEKIIKYDPVNMSYTNQVYQAGKFPVDPEYTKGVYQVTDLGNGKSKISFDLAFRTKPGFMGGMVKGSFKKLVSDYFIAIEHYGKTGEKVTKDNFKDIKKQYRS